MSILKELTSRLPANADITEIKFEGSEVVLYTKNKSFFRNSEGPVKSIVREIKKRVEVRPDLSITLDAEKARKIIEKTVPKDAGVSQIYFEPELGKVIIESQKPGLVIGKGGETFRKIKEETCWLPKIERAPAISSDIVRAVRNLLHTEIDYRKKFLNMIGTKINEEREPLDKNKDWVRFTGLGGYRQVGRSCTLLQTKRSNVLLDCGVDVSNNTGPIFEAPEFDIEKLDAIVLSHAHLDHCGHIPYLYDQGFKGPVYCTAPTRDLMTLLCMDYIDVCHKNGRESYPKKAVEKTVKHSIALEYGEVSDIANDMRLTLQPSGHLLGSSLVHLHIGEGLHNILYTGDLKFGPSRLFDAAYTDFSRAETVIIESTYGSGKDNLPSRRDAEEKLMHLINTTVKQGGKVLIPSFAVGRGQEIMAILAAREVDFPVWLEGMIWDATAIHTAYPEHMNRFVQRDIFHRGKNPFLYEKFKRVAPKERNDVIDNGEPGVVIATSGMLIGGPAVEYLRGLATGKKNTLLFVGYQGEGTPGRRIQKGWREIPMYGNGGKTQTLRIEMNVDTISGLTGHSDRSQLMSYLHKLRARPERVVIQHGEQSKCLEFARDAHRSFRTETLVPKNLESVRIN